MTKISVVPRSPKEIAQDGKVADYYNRLNEQLAGLEQLAAKLSKTAGGDTAQVPAKQLRSNLSFMDMVNHIGAICLHRMKGRWFPIGDSSGLRQRPGRSSVSVYNRAV